MNVIIDEAFEGEFFLNKGNHIFYSLFFLCFH